MVPTPLLGVDFSVKPRFLEQIPCYFIDADRRFKTWSLQAKHLLHLLDPDRNDSWTVKPARTGINARDFAPSLWQNELSDLLRKRCRDVRASMMEQRNTLREILTHCNPDTVSPQELQSYLESRGNTLPELWHFFDYVHRDWGFETDENERALKTVLSLLRNESPRRVLIPGAGACRLAYDLQQALRPEITLATEVHPLLCLCASRILNGQKFTLYEFPKYPLNLDGVAVGHELSLKGKPANDRIQLVMSDITEGVVAAESFDLVVTNWFIDAVPIELNRLFCLINQLLIPNGVWVNIGPTMFAGYPSRAYCVEEVLETVARTGFRLEANSQGFTDYFSSPSSATRRSERILAFRARKATSVEPLGPSVTARAHSQEIPKWLLNQAIPVELQLDVREYATAHLATAEVLLGAREGLSIGEIAARVSEKLSLPAEVARSHTERTLRSLVGLAKPA